MCRVFSFWFGASTYFVCYFLFLLFLYVGVDDNRTVIISAPTSDASPVGVDFYEMRRRNKIFEDSEKNYNYGPFGVLIETVEAEVRQLIGMID